MPTILNPYLSFRDNTREAIEFYHSVFGGNVTLFTFKDLQAAQDPSDENLVMHSQLDTPGGLTLMASDTPSRMELHPGDNIMISVSGEDEAELRGYWEKLSQGAQITMPLAEVPWSKAFGMLVDKFGIHWLVNANQAPQG
ncbi:MAG: VOC family protein [Candidatus Dormibacteraeota bacterium]|nr:VOC family protein [Candidatus Dormibacteraeota bacterium]